MAVDTPPKAEAATLTLRVPQDLKDVFNDAARIISEITPKKPVDLEDLMTFMLLKESTGTIVVEFIEFVQNSDDSVIFENGAGRSQPSPRQRAND